MSVQCTVKFFFSTFVNRDMKNQEFVFRKITQYIIRKFVIRDLVIKLYAAFFDSVEPIPTYQNRDNTLNVKNSCLCAQ